MMMESWGVDRLKWYQERERNEAEITEPFVETEKIRNEESEKNVEDAEDGDKACRSHMQSVKKESCC